MFAEKVARLEKEAQSLKRVSEEVFRVQKQLDGEKVARDAAAGQLQSNLQQLLGMASERSTCAVQSVSSCVSTVQCLLLSATNERQPPLPSAGVEFENSVEPEFLTSLV